MALRLVDDGAVVELGTVGGEVDGLRRRGEEGDFAACIVVALFEREQGGGRLAFEAERAGYFCPVELGGGGALGVGGGEFGLVMRDKGRGVCYGRRSGIGTYSDSHFCVVGKQWEFQCS